MSKLVLAALMVVGCKGKPPPQPIEGSAFGGPTTVPIAITKQNFGDKPHPLGKIAAVKRGMPLREAQQLVQNDPAIAPAQVAAYRESHDPQKASGIVALTYSQSVIETVIAAWGPGQPYHHDSQWLADGWRITFQPSRVGSSLVFEPFAPLASYLTDDPSKLGFETAPILGATLDEVAAAYGPAFVRNPPLLELPVTELGQLGDPTTVELEVDAGGKVAAMTLKLDCTLVRDQCEQIRDIALKKWGAKEPDLKVSRPHRSIKVDHDGVRWAIVVRAAP